MSIFNEYLTGLDRELAIEESAFDTEFSKLNTMYEMVNLQLTQMQKDAELKVLTESGTYDDLTYLISEAETEVGQQKKGIIATIIDAIGRLFSAIGTKISQIFGKGEANMEVEAPAETVEKGNAIVNAMNEAHNGDFSGALNLLNAVKIPVITAGGAVATGVAIKKYKKGELDGLVKKVQDGFNKLKADFEAAKTKIFGTKETTDQDAQKGSLNIIQKIGSAINGFVGTITSYITKAITKVTGDKKEEGQPAEGDNKPEQKTAGEEQPTVKLEEQSKNKKRYRLLSNGKWEMYDKQIKVWKPITTPPTDLAQKAYQLTQESSVEDLQTIFGSTYIVEKTDDGFIFIENEVEITESTSRSIFGYDLDNEEVLQESVDAFDKELDELAALFSTL